LIEYHMTKKIIRVWYATNLHKNNKIHSLDTKS
jgi:hypothetical protein